MGEKDFDGHPLWNERRAPFDRVDVEKKRSPPPPLLSRGRRDDLAQKTKSKKGKGRERREKGEKSEIAEREKS
eukprot:scaffold19241_cov23-Tisochrysis_lutea.AAC.2